MTQRIRTLHRLLFRRLIFSIVGLIFVLTGFGLWLIFFNPQDGRVPEGDYFILLIGMYGAALSFLVTLSVATQANRAESYAIFARLPSRIEYLASVLLTSLQFTTLIQLILAIVISLQPNGPEMMGWEFLQIPPIWLAINIFFAVLALHATDFVMSGWSRIWVFGVLAILLFSQSIDVRGIRWLTDRFNGLATSASLRGWTQISQWLRQLGSWTSRNGLDFLENSIGFIFWPFDALSRAIQAGFFTDAQALAPAILLLYATILFMLAADLFATKDLFLSE